jgi:hypothetical protein
MSHQIAPDTSLDRQARVVTNVAEDGSRASAPASWFSTVWLRSAVETRTQSAARLADVAMTEASHGSAIRQLESLKPWVSVVAVIHELLDKIQISDIVLT